MDFTFDGPYGVYHSAYDSHAWMSRFGDPDFAYHAAMARLWGVMALRLANADVLPFDYAAYGRDLLVYIDDVTKVAQDRRWRSTSRPRARGRPVRSRTCRPQAAATGPAAARANRALMQAERDLLSPEGIPDRPWFRHLVYAPLPSYEAETLPGVREAVVAGDAAPRPGPGGPAGPRDRAGRGDPARALTTSQVPAARCAGRRPRSRT